MLGLAILLLFNYAGVVLHEQCHVPLPGNVLGFVLLTAALFARVIKIEWVEETAEMLIRHLPLLFSPSIVLAASMPVIAEEWPAVVVGMVGSMAVTLLVTGWSVQLVAGRKRRGGERMIILGLSDAATHSPMFGLSLTVGCYAVALAVRPRWRWMHPIVVTCAATLLVLWVMGWPFGGYRVGGDLITLGLGPATVALAVPLYRHAARIRAALWPVLAGVAVGSVVGVASGAAFVLMVRGSRLIMLSMMPKSVTTPISMEISRLIGGRPELTAALTVLTGLLGSIVGPTLLRICGVRQAAAVGVAMGAATHGIGTARMFEDDEVKGSFSAVAMGLCGIVTTVLAIPWAWG